MDTQQTICMYMFVINGIILIFLSLKASPYLKEEKRNTLPYNLMTKPGSFWDEDYTPEGLKIKKWINRILLFEVVLFLLFVLVL